MPRMPGRGARTILLYGILCGLLVLALDLVQYRFLIVAHSLEIYGGIVAVLFAALGIWLGQKLTRRMEPAVVQPAAVVQAPAGVDRARLDALGITAREHEILMLIAEGLSNREIAERLFVSENTVKTHARRLFDKLQARRRTQAVQLAKEAGLLA